MSENRVNTRRLFYKSKGLCSYCKSKTKLQESHVGKCKNNIATSEHIYSKLDIRRLLSEKTILACYGCNISKAQREYDLIYNNGTYQAKEYSNYNQLNNGLLLKLYNNEINTFII